MVLDFVEYEGAIVVPDQIWLSDMVFFLLHFVFVSKMAYSVQIGMSKLTRGDDVD